MGAGGAPMARRRRLEPRGVLTVPTEPAVLALEFHAVRKTADFSFLREPERAGRLLQVDPLEDHLVQRLSMERQSHLLLERLRVPPTLILAYCGCAALAAHTAALCDADLLLVDPDVVDPNIAHRDFLQLCATLNFDPAACGDTARTGWLTQWDVVLAATRDRLAAEYGGDLEAYEMVDDLFERYRSWARFLEASLNTGPANPDGEVTVISGRPVPNLGALLASPERAGIHQVTPNADTLSLPEVQDLVRQAFHKACG